MKPIEKAYIMDNACPNCGVLTNYAAHTFYCRLYSLGEFNEACLVEDWEGCPFNQIKLPPDSLPRVELEVE